MHSKEVKLTANGFIAVAKASKQGAKLMMEKRESFNGAILRSKKGGGVQGLPLRRIIGSRQDFESGRALSISKAKAKEEEASPNHKGSWFTHKLLHQLADQTFLLKKMTMVGVPKL